MLLSYIAEQGMTQIKATPSVRQKYVIQHALIYKRKSNKTKKHYIQAVDNRHFFSQF